MSQVVIWVISGNSFSKERIGSVPMEDENSTYKVLSVCGEFDKNLGLICMGDTFSNNPVSA